MVGAEGARILRRVIVGPEGASVPRVVADWFMSLDFAPQDHARFAELSAKAQEGVMSEQDRRQLIAYLEIDGLLSLLRLMAEPPSGVNP